MEYLDSVFQLWLTMLRSIVADNVFGSVLWVFILIMTLLILIKIWRGVTSWTS